jgi:hypothetical protein
VSQFVASDVLHVCAAYSEVVAAVCGEVDGGFKEQIGSTLFFLNNNCSTV